MGANLVQMFIGCVSLAIALIGGVGSSGKAGLVFFAIGPCLTIYYTIMGRVERNRSLADS